MLIHTTNNIDSSKDDQLFDFGGHNVRVVLDERQAPRFVLKDVCEVLELQAPHMVADRLEEHDRMVVCINSCVPGQSVS